MDSMSLERSAFAVVPARTTRSADTSPRWFAGRAWGLLLVTVYPLLAAAPLVAFAVLNGVSDHLRGAELGADCGVVGFTVLALQFVITARLSWVEAPFGLDVLLVFHRAMALVAVGLLCVHPILLAREEGWSLLRGWSVPWFIWVGRLGAALLLVQLIASLARRVIRLPYERWRRLHNGAALTILSLGFVHSLAAGDDPRGPAILVWCGMMATAVGFWLYVHVVRPRRLRRHPFCVVEVKAEAPRVWTLILKTPGGRPFRFAAGQFQFLRLHGAEVFPEEHPFTIASSPSRADRIALTIKESGDFTSRISLVRPGDLATVHGPFGRFSHALHPEERDLVFVAGGVGITPLMSMLRSMRDRSEARRVFLAYASRGAADILFANELEAMRADGRPELRVVHVVESAHPSWIGETGRLDANRVARLCGGIEGKAIYLCCPPPMMTALIQGFLRLGVSPRHIHADRFSL